MANPLPEKRPKISGIGQDIWPKRDLTCFVKGPCYTVLQQQRAVLHRRLKVTPAKKRFTQAAGCQTQVLKLAHGHRPDTDTDQTRA